MNSLEFLQGIRAILSGPEKWTQGRLAKCEDHMTPTPAASPKAACWCIIGAGDLLTQNTSTCRSGDWLGKLLQLSTLYPWIKSTHSYYRQTVIFNDAEGTTFEMVADALDKAIARETAKLTSAPATPTA